MSDGSYHIDHKIKFGSGSTLAVDADLDNMSLTIEKLPDVTLRVKDLPRIEFGDFNMRVKELPKVELDANTTSAVSLDANTTSTVNLAIKEIPEVRTHLPSHYNFGLAIFGVEVVNFSLCGESQVITEKYVPRRMEICK